jgi:hypothetical protein
MDLHELVFAEEFVEVAMGFSLAVVAWFLLVILLRLGE